MHKRIVKKLVENKSYFTELDKVSCSRIIGINEYSLPYDDDERFDRQNLWYFSDDFEIILNNYLANKTEKSTEITKNIINPYEITKLFNDNKNNLIDLSWIIVDYF